MELMLRALLTYSTYQFFSSVNTMTFLGYFFQPIEHLFHPLYILVAMFASVSICLFVTALDLVPKSYLTFLAMVSFDTLWSLAIFLMEQMDGGLHPCRWGPATSRAVGMLAGLVPPHPDSAGCVGIDPSDQGDCLDVITHINMFNYSLRIRP